MKLSGVALSLALGMLAAQASALTTLTNSECLNFSPGAFGIADKIDGTGGGALGVGSGAPYNQDMTDDALICADNPVLVMRSNGRPFSTARKIAFARCCRITAVGPR